MTIEISESQTHALPENVRDELANYEQQIRRYRAGEVDETKMQKLRLHFGTYAQRQDGVQMQRIKIPGGFLSADQLLRLADAADRFGSGFLHLTTREDAQIYYVRLEETPDLLRFLAEAGITSREACGNTVRNITACYRAGTSDTESFNVLPYSQALFRFLVRNKYNQNLGRKFKITFEGCRDDHSALRIHDIGLWAVSKIRNGKLKRGFRVYLGGGLGATPHLAHLYTDFLPADELFNLAAASLRLFDRYGERKARMKARMKFLVESLGWEAFRRALDDERKRVGAVPLTDYLEETNDFIPETRGHFRALKLLDPRTSDPQFQAWARDSVIGHKIPGFRGVHVRIKLGDLTAERARGLAEIVRRFSRSQLRISIEQNIYLPWVREEELSDVYAALADLSLADRGVGTITDVTTCPGSDTCRLGIASAKGLGSALSFVLGNRATGSSVDPTQASLHGEPVKRLRIKVSGCPNGCAQHSIANIGFYAAALSQEDRSVPAYFVTLAGESSPESAQFGSLLGKFPAKNCVALTETLLGLYEKEKLPAEEFNSFLSRTGTKRLKEILDPLRHVPSFETDPSFYEDYGHEHESFAVRRGIKGECAGSTVAAALPTIEAAREQLAQAEALIYHQEYKEAALAAYEAAAAAARVPLYQRLVDPFTADEALWEFENLFVLSGETGSLWEGVSSLFEDLLSGVRQTADVRQTSVCRSLAWGTSSAGSRQTEVCRTSRTPEDAARKLLDEARRFVSYCAEPLSRVSGVTA
ncbi:MAG TPA: nitrite/sulfite reductase [Pyrinomonadaceae bacterium]|nr:nitrite/sulfite reductase [Pyrinomonadaceae bacterium]